MKITSAKFMRGVGGTDELLADGTPQVAFIGRSNVGKSSIINSLTDRKDLARTSDTPGLTQEINIYLINDALYLLDLPGYGYAKAPQAAQERLQKLIYWYFFDSPYEQKKTVLVMDASIGPTENDLQTLKALREHQKDVVIVANKIDKIKKSEYEERLSAFSGLVGAQTVIPYSSKTMIGIEDLTREILE